MTILSIDPGRKTGCALLDFDSERVIWCGLFKRSRPTFRQGILILMERADWLVIESGQFAKQNVHSALSIAQAKGEMIGLWPGPRERVIEFAASSWQRHCGLRGGREGRKAGALVLARAALDCDTKGGELTEDTADAICMGLAAARMLKAQRLIGEARLAGALK